MFKQLTVTSAAEYDRILYGQMTPQMAVSYLLENRLPVRTFSGVLQQMYPGKDLQMRLVDFFVSTMPEANPQSIVKRSRTGFRIKTCPLPGRTCFALPLPWGLAKASWTIC